jgi:hypothetical protein
MHFFRAGSGAFGLPRRLYLSRLMSRMMTRVGIVAHVSAIDIASAIRYIQASLASQRGAARCQEEERHLAYGTPRGGETHADES